MASLMKPEQLPVLLEELVKAIVSIDGLKDWLKAHYPEAQAHLGGGNLQIELTNLVTWADSEDGMQKLLQQLANHPPSEGTSWLIYAFAQIKAPFESNHGLPPQPPERNWLPADRPFVNRTALRDHLRELGGSAGARSVLVIDGEKRTGKSFALTLAMGFDAARNSHPRIDIDQYAQVGQLLNARDLAVAIAGGDEQDCPSFDPTKEDEVVPRLVFWLLGKLRGKNLWILVDHCNRPVLTQAARRILGLLAAELRNGTLPGVRLILVDFDRNELPREWRDFVRYDRASLPDLQHVEEWLQQLATAAKRKFEPEAPAHWANQIFSGLEGQSLEDGSWHIELERRLRKAVQGVMDCEVVP